MNRTIYSFIQFFNEQITCLSEIEKKIVVFILQKYNKSASCVFVGI